MRALFFSIELIFQSVLDITFVSKLDRLSSTALMADDKKASQQLLQQLKQQLDAIKQEKVKNPFIYQDLRQDVLKSQGRLLF
jgi:hypothetical protein